MILSAFIELILFGHPHRTIHTPERISLTTSFYNRALLMKSASVVPLVL